MNRYDHLGRRVQKIAPDGTHTFLYDGWRPVVETVERIGGGTDRIEYYWGKDLSGTLDGAAGVGGLLYVKRNGAIYVPFYDAFGNVMGYWDEQGNVVAEYVYDAFGRTVAKSGTMADMFAIRYSTKYYDAETGMYYYGRRFYVMSLCRWLTRDPIEEEGGVNLYEFCGNNSAFFNDPRGTVVITGFYGDHSVPSPWDHFGFDTSPLGQEAWFERNYPGLLKHARKLFATEINAGVDCCSSVFSGKSSRINIVPYKKSGWFTTNSEMGGNESVFGDVAQSAWSADKILGQFSVDYVTPVRIIYSVSGKRKRYFWTTTMYVEDILGTQKGDLIRYIPGVIAITPGRRVWRASWPLSGSGVCCE